MSTEVHTVGDGPLSQVTHDGLTVVSNSETAEEMKGNLEAEPKPLDGEPEDPKEAEKKRVSKAASELGKKGGEAAAKARAEKDDLAEEPEPEAKEETKEEEKPGNPRKDARARVMEATRQAAEARKAREAAEARAEALEARLARLEAATKAAEGGAGKEPQKAVTGEQRSQGGNGKPTPDGFDTYEEYVEALADWRIEQRVAKMTREAEIQNEAGRHADRIGKTVQAFNERVMKAAEVDADLMRRVSPEMLELKPTFTLPPGTPARPENDIAQAIVESEHPEALLVHFSEHSEDYERLLRLPDTYQVVRAIGALEARLEKGQQPGNVIAEAVSKAKPPVKPISGSAQYNDDLSDDIDFDEYVRLANARDRRRR
jgi:hypothetical protein